jgi:hypothetical protein
LSLLSFEVAKAFFVLNGGGVVWTENLARTFLLLVLACHAIAKRRRVLANQMLKHPDFILAT